MRLRALFADVLPDLKLAQLVDQPRAERDAEEQRRQAGERGAEGGVAEDAERADVSLQLFVERNRASELRHEPFQRLLDLHAARPFEQHRVAGRATRARELAGLGGILEELSAPHGIRPAAAPSTMERALPRTPISRSTPCSAAYRPTRRCNSSAACAQFQHFAQHRDALRRAGVSRSTSIIDCAASGLEL